MKRTLVLVIAVIALACGDHVTNVYVEGDGRNVGSGPGSSPTPAPSAAAGLVSSVTVNGFDNGEQCPADIQPAAQNRRFRRGCTLAITCNPKTSSGTVIRDTSITGTVPDSFVVPTQGIVIVQDGFLDNAYNKLLTSPRNGPTGAISAPCVVRGVASLPGTHEFEVVP